MTMNPVRRCFGRILGQQGFQLHSGSWYLATQETQMVIELQKSQFSGECYVNVGLNLLRPDLGEYPKVARCDVYARLPSLFPQVDWNRYDTALDLESDLSDLRRCEAVRDLTKETVERLVGDIATTQGFVSFVFSPVGRALRLDLRCALRVPDWRHSNPDPGGTN